MGNNKEHLTIYLLAETSQEHWADEEFDCCGGCGEDWREGRHLAHEQVQALAGFSYSITKEDS